MTEKAFYHPPVSIPSMEYKGYTYNVQGEPGNYCYQILKDDIQIEQPEGIFTGVVPANVAARKRIDEIVSTEEREIVEETGDW